MGTIAYMAPELADRSKPTFPTADLFALGVMAYEMLTGNYPFRVPPLVQALAGQPPPPAPPLPGAVPEDLRLAVRRCLDHAAGRPCARDVADLVARTMSSTS